MATSPGFQDVLGDTLLPCDGTELGVEFAACEGERIFD